MPEGGDVPVKKRRYYGSVPSGVPALCCCLLLLLILAGITALVLYLVYRPSKPRFTVVSVGVYELNASSPAALTTVSTSMQFTVAVRNPSGRSSVLYDRLAAYVAYRGQAITPPAPLPPLYQEEDSTTMVSALVGGEGVPVSEEVAEGLAADRAYGMVPVRLVVLGRLKYKAGPFRSAWGGLYVRCDLLLGVKKGRYGQVPLLGATDCSVDT